MDKGFVRDWLKYQYDISDNAIPPFSMVLDECGNHFYPRRSGKYEYRSERDKMKYYSLIPPSEIKEIVEVLLDYCDRYTDEEVRVINEKIREKLYVGYEWDKHFNDELKPVYKIKESKCRAGYIYMLKCADKVKIGYSKNVEQRIRQLDVRPFDIELVFKEYNEKAYQIEQHIHRCLEDYRFKGEWYSDKITEDLIRNMIDTLDDEIEVVEG